MSGLKEKFSKILVAIDGSQPSMDAVDYAIAIAQRNTSRRRNQRYLRTILENHAYDGINYQGSKFFSSYYIHIKLTATIDIMPINRKAFLAAINC